MNVEEPAYKWKPGIPRYGWELQGAFIIIQDYDKVIMKISIHEVLDGTSVSLTKSALAEIEKAPWKVK